ncbi:MAG TPA: YdeI/OmpD-associated family protein [Verrucomicrobiae bacterium]|nr:YdeI/OmpD-associated family protein [Verrucomicrobiae bacterium]
MPKAKSESEGRARFRAVIEQRGINPFVRVSARRVAAIRKGWRRPLPVRVRVNGKPDEPWRINLMPAGDGSFYLYLHAEVRKASRSKVGDAVTVDLEFDGEYRNGPMHPMPSWFGAALEREARARRGWDGLSPSRQKEILRYFAGLKSAAAQERNLGRAMEVLAGGRARFMAREWNGE